MTETMPPRFREAAVGDADALTDLARVANQRALGHIFPPERYPFPTDVVRARWHDIVDDPSVWVYVSEDDDGLTPFVAFSGGLLRHLAVRPDVWGAGLATAAIDWARACEPIQRLWCLDENDRALRFYERYGWRRSGRQKRAEYPPHPGMMELVLEKGGHPVVPLHQPIEG